MWIEVLFVLAFLFVLGYLFFHAIKAFIKVTIGVVVIIAILGFFLTNPFGAGDGGAAFSSPKDVVVAGDEAIDSNTSIPQQSEVISNVNSG